MLWNVGGGEKRVVVVVEEGEQKVASVTILQTVDMATCERDG